MGSKPKPAEVPQLEFERDWKLKGSEFSATKVLRDSYSFIEAHLLPETVKVHH